MNEHRHIETIQVLKNKGIILLFDDGSHTYIEPADADKIVSTILNLELPFPD